MPVNEGAEALCDERRKKNRYKTWSYLNGRFVSIGSLVLGVCSVDLQEVFSRGT